MKRGILASYVLLFAGFVLLSLSSGSNITGNFVFGESFGTFGSLAGLIFIGASIGLFLAEGGLEQEVKGEKSSEIKDYDVPYKKAIMRQLRKKEGKEIDWGEANEYLERARNKYERIFSDEEKGKSQYKEFKEKFNLDPHIKISNRAIERANKDRTIRENFDKYLDMISKLNNGPESHKKRKSHKIGDFQVYKPGDISERIAYHKKGNKIIVDDLLYHIDEKNYNDKWNKKAANGEITLDYYKDKGYTNLGDVPRSA